jgi:hypothetical protein
MARDIVDLVEPFLSEDPTRWGKLASDVQWRRLQLLLLREILVELRKLKQGDEDVAQREVGNELW